MNAPGYQGHDAEPEPKVYGVVDCLWGCKGTGLTTATFSPIFAGKAHTETTPCLCRECPHCEGEGCDRCNDGFLPNPDC